jgi:hypothetical protein
MTYGGPGGNGPDGSGAKNLALDFSADKQQGEMLRGVYPDPAAAGERAQHDNTDDRPRSLRSDVSCLLCIYQFPYGFSREVARHNPRRCPFATACQVQPA